MGIAKHQVAEIVHGMSTPHAAPVVITQFILAKGAPAIRRPAMKQGI